MAERLQYQVPPLCNEPTAQAALDELIENLHQHGFLRLANDLVSANQNLSKILVAGLNRPGTQNAVQNLSLLMMVIGSVPPERFNHLLLAFRSALLAAKPSCDEEQQQQAPGLRGIVRLLNDDSLWRSLRPPFFGNRGFCQRAATRRGTTDYTLHRKNDP